MPPGSAADGIRFVSMRGPSGVGSGKSFTPFSRMHWANLRAACCCWVVRLLPVNPGGSRSLHALMACLNAAALGSSDEPFATASMVSSPDASGSGNALTPFVAHALGELHRLAPDWSAMLLPPLLPAPVSAGAFEPHALIRAIRAIRARAASGRSVLLMFSWPW